MKRAVVSVMTTMLLVGAIVISAPAKAMPRVEAIRGATITCRAIHVHVGGPPNTNLDHVTGYLRVDNWDTASGHDWRGFIRVWSSVANKFWRATRAPGRRLVGHVPLLGLAPRAEPHRHGPLAASLQLGVTKPFESDPRCRPGCA